MEGITIMKYPSNHTKEYLLYKKRKKIKSTLIRITQISILVLLIGIWEIFARIGIIDTFILSSPSRMWNTFLELLSSGTLFLHAGITLYEALIGFAISTLLGSLIAIILWWNDTLFKILEPYIVVINSLPKIALGPILIIWIGVGTNAIVAMDILIMIIITTI